MINDFYTTQFTVSSMIWYEDSSELETSLTFMGHIQRMSPELSENLGLTFTKACVIWCPLSTQVQAGDVLTAGLYQYNVRATKEFAMGGNSHLELFVERILETDL